MERLIIVITVFIVLFAVSINASPTFETADVLPLNESVKVDFTNDMSEYWWKITTTANGNLMISTEADESLCYNIRIYDAGNCEIGKETEAGTCASIKLKDLREGTYYILVKRREGSGQFTITTDFTCSSLENSALPDNTCPEATVKAGASD